MILILGKFKGRIDQFGQDDTRSTYKYNVRDSGRASLLLSTVQRGRYRAAGAAARTLRRGEI